MASETTGLSGGLEMGGATMECGERGLLEKAAQCRRLAAGISNRQVAETLSSMAEDYERNAGALHSR